MPGAVTQALNGPISVPSSVTMDPREAGVALELLGAKRCIPCHYGTFPLLKGTSDELRGHASGVEILALQLVVGIDHYFAWAWTFADQCKLGTRPC